MEKSKIILMTLILITLMLIAPIGNLESNLAIGSVSDCNSAFTEAVQNCTETFPADNPIVGFFQVMCIIGAGLVWLICKALNLL